MFTHLQNISDAASSALNPLRENISAFSTFQKRLSELLFFLNESSQFPFAQKRMSSSPRYVNCVCHTPPLFPPFLSASVQEEAELPQCTQRFWGYESTSQTICTTTFMHLGWTQQVLQGDVISALILFSPLKKTNQPNTIALEQLWLKSWEEIPRTQTFDN